MHAVIAKHIELNRLESLSKAYSGAKIKKDLTTQIIALGAAILPRVLAHYDRLDAQGKTPIVAGLNRTCQGCHLRLSTSAQVALLDEVDVHLCEHCGRYVYRPKLALTPEPAAPRKKGRSRFLSRTVVVCP